MSLIPTEQIKAAAHIEDVIGGFVKLKRAGSDYVGLCPFHHEKSASFMVSPAKQIYKCFGCGKSGDVFSFLMEDQGCDFPTASQYLVDQYNIIDYSAQPAPKKTSYNVTATKHRSQSSTNLQTRTTDKPKQVPIATVQATQKLYNTQPLFQWFCQHFGYHAAISTFRMYHVGTAKDGGTIFWQLDYNGAPAMAQKILYTGFRRDKEAKYGVVKLYKGEDGYQSCFFGEHLLGIMDRMGIDPLVCIVESEKSAMVCQLYLPALSTQGHDERPCVWLAAVGSNGATEEKIRVLRNRAVILFPDFKYINRGSWGLVEMRWSIMPDPAGGKPKRTPDPNGDIVDPEFRSLKQRILDAGARHVNVFDTCPHQQDGADIADHLVKERRPVTYSRPEAQAYLLASANPGAATLNEQAAPATLTRAVPKFGDVGFEKVFMENMIAEYPQVGQLITRLGLIVQKIDRI